MTGRAIPTRVQIIEGDALEVMPTLEGRFDLVLTDPPYMIGAVSAGSLNSKAGTWGDMMNSSRWFATWYTQCRRLLRQDGAMWTFCNWRSLPVVMKAALDSQWGITSLLVWQKGPELGNGHPAGLRGTHEFVALLAMPEFRIPNRSLPDFVVEPWGGSRFGSDKALHPAQKPVPLLRWIIEASDKSDGRILDPFMGSGSTLRAALDAGCEAVGIETEAKWCQIAEERCAQMILGDVA